MTTSRDDDNLFDLDDDLGDGLTRRERRERERLETDGDGVRAETAEEPAFADPLLSLEAPAAAEVIPEEPSPAAVFAETPHPRRRPDQRRVRPRRPLRRPAR